MAGRRHLDDTGRCCIATGRVVVRYRCHVVLVSVGRLVLGFLRPVLDVLDGLRQRAVERLWKEKNEKTAADRQSAEENARQPRYHTALFQQQ